MWLSLSVICVSVGVILRVSGPDETWHSWHVGDEKEVIQVTSVSEQKGCRRAGQCSSEETSGVSCSFCCRSQPELGMWVWVSSPLCPEQLLFSGPLVCFGSLLDEGR